MGHWKKKKKKAGHDSENISHERQWMDGRLKMEDEEKTMRTESNSWLRIECWIVKQS